MYFLCKPVKYNTLNNEPVQPVDVVVYGMQADGQVRRFEFRGYFHDTRLEPARRKTVGILAGSGSAALGNGHDRGRRYFPRHAGQIQVGIVLALATPLVVGSAVDRNRDGGMLRNGRRNPPAARFVEQATQQARQYDRDFTHA